MLYQIILGMIDHRLESRDLFFLTSKGNILELDKIFVSSCHCLLVKHDKKLACMSMLMFKKQFNSLGVWGAQ